MLWQPPAAFPRPSQARDTHGEDVEVQAEAAAKTSPAEWQPFLTAFYPACSLHLDQGQKEEAVKGKRGSWFPCLCADGGSEPASLEEPQPLSSSQQPLNSRYFSEGL